MQRNPSWFSWLLVSACCLVWSAGADPGFFSYEHAPTSIRSLAPSVFRLVVHGASPVSRFRPSSLINLGQSIPLTYSGLDRWWRRFELDHFAHGSGLEQYEVAYGTGFLAKDRRTLLTSRHLLDAVAAQLPQGYREAVSYADAQRALEAFALRLVVIDHSGEVVFESRSAEAQTAGRSAKIRFNGHPSLVRQWGEPFARMSETSAQDLLDLLEIELEEELPGEPLAFAAKLPLPGEPVYALSFPSPTQGRLSNASGEGARLSLGKAMAAPEFHVRYLNAQESRKESALAFLRAHLYADLDMVGGSSGAPVLNAQGEVVALYSAHWTDPAQEAASLEKSYSARGGYGLAGPFVRRLLDEPHTD